MTGKNRLKVDSHGSIKLGQIRQDFCATFKNNANTTPLIAQKLGDLSGKAYHNPSSSSVALCSYFSFGGHGRARQSGSKTKDDRLRPGSNAPFPAPLA